MNIYADSVCRLCGKGGALERHHVFNGNPNRKLSEKYGLVVYLCPPCHREVHANIKTRLKLKQETQAAAMAYYNWNFDDWRGIFGKNYL